MTGLSPHPFAELIPPMSDDEFTALCEDIREHGMREPVVIYEGLVLDGRHRARACGGLGIEPLTREYEGDDPLGYVISANLHRRHLNTAQRAMVAARIATLRKGQKPDPRKRGSTQVAASKLLRVGKNVVGKARVIQERGVPELLERVNNGHISVEPAEQIARLAPEDQRIELARREEKATSGRQQRDRKLTESQRQREIAALAHKRLCSVCGWLDGLVAGLPRLRVDSALAVASDSDRQQIAESLSAGISALRKLLAQVKEGKP